MVSKKVLALIFCLSIGFTQLILAQTAYTVDEIPDPKTTGNGYVSNPDHYLSDGDVGQLNATIAALESKTKVQIAVVVVRTFDPGQEDFEFALNLFRKWGIGKGKANNGLLLFIAIDQRKYRFITGYGLEGLLPDLRLRRIAQRDLVPAFREGKYSEGTIKALTAISDYLDRPENAEELDQLLVKQANLFSDQYLNLGIIIFLFIASLYGIRKLVPGQRNQIAVVKNGYERIVYAGCLVVFLVFVLPVILVFVFLGKAWFKSLAYQDYTYIVYGILALIVFFRYIGALGVIRRTHFDDKNFRKAAWRFNLLALLFVVSSPLILVFLIFDSLRLLLWSSRFKAPLDKQNLPMLRIDRDISLSGKPFISDGQRAEEELEVYHYDIWLSTNEKEYKIIPYRAINYPIYDYCPQCKMKTFSGKKNVVLKSATYSRQGEGKKVRLCGNCNYEELIKMYIIPVLRRSSDSSRSSSGGSSGGGSSSSSSSSGWGGGSSGGGGSGGSW